MVPLSMLLSLSMLAELVDAVLVMVRVVEKFIWKGKEVVGCELKLTKGETGVLGNAVVGVEVRGVEVAKLRELPMTVEGREVEVGKLRELPMTAAERE